MRHRVIHLHAQAPAKPPVGAACNGCGVCCAAEPCPLGMVVSRRVRGACSALAWNEAEGRYRCGLAASPPAGLPRRLVLRWIGAAAGCDSTLEPA